MARQGLLTIEETIEETIEVLYYDNNDKNMIYKIFDVILKKSFVLF